MNSDANWQAQWEAFRHGFETGRLAHAYIIHAPPRGTGLLFVQAVLRLLYQVQNDHDPMAKHLRERSHPDVNWMEPVSKSRMIRVDDMRQLNKRLQQTASGGGWKVGVILAADRMNPETANAFLKTLEEPPDQTLILLVTDAPHLLLPTVRSRCQQIVLSRQSGELEGDRLERTLAVLREYQAEDVLDQGTAATRMQHLMETFTKELEKEHPIGKEEAREAYEARISALLREIRAQVLAVMLHWQRDLLLCVLGNTHEAFLYFPDEFDVLCAQAQGLTSGVALRRIAAVEEMAGRIDRNVPALLAFEAGFARQLAKRNRA